MYVWKYTFHIKKTHLLHHQKLMLNWNEIYIDGMCLWNQYLSRSNAINFFSKLKIKTVTRNLIQNQTEFVSTNNMKCLSLRQWTESSETDFIIYNWFELITKCIQIEFLIGKKHKFCRLSLKNNLFPKKTGYGQEFFMGLVFKHTAKLYIKHVWWLKEGRSIVNFFLFKFVQNMKLAGTVFYLSVNYVYVVYCLRFWVHV